MKDKKLNLIVCSMHRKGLCVNFHLLTLQFTADKRQGKYAGLSLNSKNLRKKAYDSLTYDLLILKLPFLLNNSSELKRLDSFEFQRIILRLR